MKEKIQDLKDQSQRSTKQHLLAEGGGKLRTSPLRQTAFKSSLTEAIDLQRGGKRAWKSLTNRPSPFPFRNAGGWFEGGNLSGRGGMIYEPGRVDARGGN